MRKLTTLFVTLGILGTAAIASADERYVVPSQTIEVRDHRTPEWRPERERAEWTRDRMPDTAEPYRMHHGRSPFRRGFVWVPAHREFHRGRMVWVPGHFERARAYGYGYGYGYGRR